MALRGKILGCVAAAGLMAATAFPALAQEAKAYRNDISEYQLRMEQLRSLGDTSPYSNEITQINSQIDEALIHIGRDEASKVKALMTKIGVYVDYVEASVQRDTLVAKAAESEAKLKAVKAEYGKLEAFVEQLKAEEDILKAKMKK